MGVVISLHISCPGLPHVYNTCLGHIQRRSLREAIIDLYWQEVLYVVGIFDSESFLLHLPLIVTSIHVHEAAGSSGTTIIVLARI